MGKVIERQLRGHIGSFAESEGKLSRNAFAIYAAKANDSKFWM